MRVVIRKIRLIFNLARIIQKYINGNVKMEVAQDAHDFDEEADYVTFTDQRVLSYTIVQDFYNTLAALGQTIRAFIGQMDLSDALIGTAEESVRDTLKDFQLSEIGRVRLLVLAELLDPNGHTDWSPNALSKQSLLLQDMFSELESNEPSLTKMLASFPAADDDVATYLNAAAEDDAWLNNQFQVSIYPGYSPDDAPKSFSIGTQVLILYVGTEFNRIVGTVVMVTEEMPPTYVVQIGSLKHEFSSSKLFATAEIVSKARNLSVMMRGHIEHIVGRRLAVDLIQLPYCMLNVWIRTVETAGLDFLSGSEVIGLEQFKDAWEAGNTSHEDVDVFDREALGGALAKIVEDYAYGDVDVKAALDPTAYQHIETMLTVRGSSRDALETEVLALGRAWSIFTDTIDNALLAETADALVKYKLARRVTKDEDLDLKGDLEGHPEKGALANVVDEVLIRGGYKPDDSGVYKAASTDLGFPPETEDSTPKEKVELLKQMSASQDDNYLTLFDQLGKQLENKSYQAEVDRRVASFRDLKSIMSGLEGADHETDVAEHMRKGTLLPPSLLDTVKAAVSGILEPSVSKVGTDAFRFSLISSVQMAGVRSVAKGSSGSSVAEALVKRMPDVAYMLRRPFDNLRYLMEGYLAKNSQEHTHIELARAERKAAAAILVIKQAAAEGVMDKGLYLREELGAELDTFAAEAMVEYHSKDDNPGVFTQVVEADDDSRATPSLRTACQALLGTLNEIILNRDALPAQLTTFADLKRLLVRVMFRHSSPLTTESPDEVQKSGVPALDTALVLYAKLFHQYNHAELFNQYFVAKESDAKRREKAKTALSIVTHRILESLDIVSEIRSHRKHKKSEIKIPRPLVRLMMCMCATVAQQIDDSSVNELLKYFPSDERRAPRGLQSQSEADEESAFWTVPVSVMKDLLSRFIAALRYLSNPAVLLENGFSVMLHLYIKFMHAINSMAEGAMEHWGKESLVSSFIVLFSSFTNNISNAWSRLFDADTGFIVSLFSEASQKCIELGESMAEWGQRTGDNLKWVWDDLCRGDDGDISKEFKKHLTAAIESAKGVPSLLYKAIAQAGAWVIDFDPTMSKDGAMTIRTLFLKSAPYLVRIGEAINMAAGTIALSTQDVLFGLTDNAYFAPDKDQKPNFVEMFAKFAGTTEKKARAMMVEAHGKIRDAYDHVRNYALITYYTSGIDQARNIRQYLPKFLNNIVQDYFALFVGSRFASGVADTIVHRDTFAPGSKGDDDYKEAKKNMTVKVGVGAGLAVGVAAAVAIFVAVRSKMKGRKRKQKLVSRRRDVRLRLQHKLGNASKSPRTRHSRMRGERAVKRLNRRSPRVA